MANAETRTAWPRAAAIPPSQQTLLHSDAARCRRVCDEIDSLVEDMLQRDFKNKARWLLDMILYDVPTILDRQYATVKKLQRSGDSGARRSPIDSEMKAAAKEYRRIVISKITPVLPPLNELAAGRAPTNPIEFVLAALQLKEALERDLEIHRSIVR